MNSDICGDASLLLSDPSEGINLDDRTTGWFLGQGVPIGSIASPMAVRCARVVFDQNGGRYAACRLGEFALVIPVPADPESIITDLGAIDLVAWSPKSGSIGTRLGNVFGLGAEQVGVEGMGTTGLPIPVHRTPIGWLRGGRHGLVVADWTVAAFVLSGLLLEAEDNHHRRNLLRRLTPVPPTIVVANWRAAA